jgi:hypothetical protein
MNLEQTLAEQKELENLNNTSLPYLEGVTTTPPNLLIILGNELHHNASNTILYICIPYMSYILQQSPPFRREERT